jgi:hypothetical protein
LNNFQTSSIFIPLQSRTNASNDLLKSMNLSGFSVEPEDEMFVDGVDSRNNSFNMFLCGENNTSGGEGGNNSFNNMFFGGGNASGGENDFFGGSGASPGKSDENNMLF